MCSKVILLLAILSIPFSNGAVLLWSNKKLEIPPLNGFTDKNLDDLIEKLGYPEVSIYKSTNEFLPEFEGFLQGYHTAYNPNGEISTENATEITERDDLILLETKQRVDLSKGSNVLSVLFIPNPRQRRDVSEADETPPEIKPVLYRGNFRKEVYSLLYSSQPLVLRTANTSIELGDGILVTIDQQSKAFSRLDAKILVGEEKFILQFSFTWQNTYWSLSTVKVKSTMSNYSTTLIISDPFSVPARFSYHCNGVTVFSDVDKTTELLIYDMQVQPDSKDGRFNDAYDCVDFTTVPIWSGLFVTSILGVGLMIGLLAISEIKTMDKFDNQKTKQLTITVAE